MPRALIAAAGAFALLAASPARPAPLLEVSASTVRQGAALEIVFRGRPARTPVVRFAGRTWPLYREGAAWRTYVGADAATPPGAYRLTVQAGAAVLAGTTVQVSRVAFAQRRLRVPPELLAPEQVAEEQRKVRAALRVLAPRQLWEGVFVLPAAAAPVSSPYGVLSVYNGVVQGFHRGTDFAAPAGTPVRAANTGIVRLADRLPLSGNAVVIDHGLGVLTGYFHLSALRARPGARVRKGELIGLVGSTGIATGPHLHWGLRVNGVYVDPLPWTRQGAP